ncbi:uncharacterized protein LOC113374714 [Ctenocephalides felis]|uniref:uncharacterized protein LOC113374714 n=1 Tax=Ctenocephalides felis TaxID=7515 RepID=UPI000E6E2EC8|nr:uncharacterized protein LOC113374714 [Ctenocephalides felis]
MIWLLAALGGLYGSIVCGLVKLNRYQTAASVTVFDVDWRTFNITFPAITICRDEKVNMTAVREYAKATFQDQEEAQRFETTMEELGKLNLNHMHLSPHPNIEAEDFLENILKFANKENAIIDTEVTKIMNFMQNSQLQEVITEIGICSAVNSPLSHYQSPGYWKSNSREVNMTTPKIMKANALDGQVSVHISKMYNTSYTGFIHGAFEILDVHKGIHWQSMDYISVDLNVKEITSEKDIRR